MRIRMHLLLFSKSTIFKFKKCNWIIKLKSSSHSSTIIWLKTKWLEVYKSRFFVSKFVNTEAENLNEPYKREIWDWIFGPWQKNTLIWFLSIFQVFRLDVRLDFLVIEWCSLMQDRKWTKNGNSTYFRPKIKPNFLEVSSSSQ